MRDKLNKKIKNDLTKLLNKFGINDTLSFDKPFESMLDDTMTNGLKLSETNKATFYKLTDTITFAIPDKLESCYNVSPMTIFVLLIDDLSFRSRDCKTWVAQGFGQVKLKEDLSHWQEYEVVKRFNKDTERHKLFLIKYYKEIKESTKKRLELIKEIEGKNLVKVNDKGIDDKGYFIPKQSNKLEKFIEYITDSITNLQCDKLPSEVDTFINNKRKEMSL